MTIRQLPRIYRTEELRIYRGNEVVVEASVSGASLQNFMEENSYAKQFADEEVDYIEICIEGCLGETLVMEIYLKNFSKTS